MAWTYKREEQEFEEIPVGDYRCRIEEVEKTTSKNGNDMIVLKLRISGQSRIIYHYVVFLPERPEITNRNLTAIFDSFGIDEGDFVLEHWKNKGGACHVKHDEEGKARIGYFISKGSVKEKSLPLWSEGSLTPLKEVEDEDLPF